MKAMIKLEQIIVDSALQPREHMSTDLVSDYAERIQEGDKFPPVVVVVDNEKSYLVDGFHRVAAYRQLEFVEVEAEVVPGSYHDAILRSAGANADHGARRTNEDKRRAVLSLLNDSQWSRKSDSWIAIQVKVDNHTVKRIRDEHLGIPKSPIRETADGRTMDTTKIGKRPEPTPVDLARDRMVHAAQSDEEEPNPEQPPRTRVGRQPEPETEPEVEPFDGSDQPDTGPPHYTYETADEALWMFGAFFDLQFKRINPAIHHQVVQDAIKYLRDIAIRFHRESVGQHIE